MQKLLILGATGLVGGHFAQRSQEVGQYSVHVLGRTAREFASGIVSHVAEPENWAEEIRAFAPDIVFCALGTTIKQAGSKAAFRSIDFDLVKMVGTAAKSAGTSHFILISSTMANSKSGGFYLKTKGEAEAALTALGFDRLDIIRPGLLRGNREGPLRLGESLAKLVSPITDMFLQGQMTKLRSIDAADVARAAVNLLAAHKNGVFVHENPAIQSLIAK